MSVFALRDSLSIQRSFLRVLTAKSLLSTIMRQSFLSPEVAASQGSCLILKITFAAVETPAVILVTTLEQQPHLPQPSLGPEIQGLET